MYGMAGQDNLYGNGGNDFMSGGTGDDYLVGDAGNDTYLFARGDGQDIVYDVDATVGNTDTIRFGAGITESDITLTRSGYDLVLTINPTLLKKRSNKQMMVLEDGKNIVVFGIVV